MADNTKLRTNHQHTGLDDHGEVLPQSSINNLEQDLSGMYGTIDWLTTAVIGKADVDQLVSVSNTVDSIIPKIPHDASAENQFATNNSVANAVQNLTARRLYSDALRTNFPTRQSLLAATEFYDVNGQITTPTSADAAIVMSDEEAPLPWTNGQTLFVYAGDPGAWGFDHGLNERPMTADEQAVLASGLSGAEKPKIDTYPAAPWQSDWEDTDDTSPSFIKNKPEIGAGGIGQIFTAQCTTAAATPAKTATTNEPGFELKQGVAVVVTFTNIDSASGSTSTTLNVNGTGAIAIEWGLVGELKGPCLLVYTRYSTATALAWNLVGYDKGAGNAYSYFCTTSTPPATEIKTVAFETSIDRIQDRINSTILFLKFTNGHSSTSMRLAVPSHNSYVTASRIVKKTDGSDVGPSDILPGKYYVFARSSSSTQSSIGWYLLNPETTAPTPVIPEATKNGLGIIALSHAKSEAANEKATAFGCSQRLNPRNLFNNDLNHEFFLSPGMRFIQFAGDASNLPPGSWGSASNYKYGTMITVGSDSNLQYGIYQILLIHLGPKVSRRFGRFRSTNGLFDEWKDLDVDPGIDSFGDSDTQGWRWVKWINGEYLACKEIMMEHPESVVSGGVEISALNWLYPPTNVPEKYSVEVLGDDEYRSWYASGITAGGHIDITEVSWIHRPARNKNIRVTITGRWK